MQTYKEHLLTTKSFGEEITGSFHKPVYRTSAIFPVINNDFIKSRILFMGYWFEKRNISQLGFLISLRAENGELVLRENSELRSPKAVEILIHDLLAKIGKEKDEFTGSIELEIFSSVDLVFPYPAFVVNYFNAFGSSVVHTTGRIFNDFEDLQANETMRVKEAGFDLHPGKQYDPFFAFVNGYLESLAPEVEVEIIKANADNYVGKIDLGYVAPLQTIIVKLKDYLPVDDFLQGEIGTLKIKHNLTGFFPRFVAGNFCTDNNAVSITHTYYDNVENDMDSAYHKNDNSDILFDSAIFIPLFLENDWYTLLKLYPIYSPSNHNINFEFYDEHGNIMGHLPDYIMISKDKSSFITIDFKSCIKEAGFDVAKIKGVRLYKYWADKTHIPTRLKYGLNIGQKNKPYDLPTNICFNSELSNIKILSKNQTFKWLPFVNSAESVVIVQNASFVRDYTKPANIFVTIFNTVTENTITRNYFIPAHGQIRITMDDEIKTFLNNKSGWLTIKSDNAFTKAWYFDFNESGIMGGDHSF